MIYDEVLVEQSPVSNVVLGGPAEPSSEPTKDAAALSGADTAPLAGARLLNTAETEETDLAVEGPSARSSEETGSEIDLPIVKIAGGDLPQIFTTVEKLLRSTGRFFTVGTRVACIRTGTLPGEVSVEAVSPARLSLVLSGLAAWFVPAGGAGNWKRVDAPDAMCAKFLKSEEFALLEPLAGIAPQPFMRGDGRICNSSGYDHVSGMYGSFAPADFPLMDNPGRKDAVGAVERLCGLLQDFPFATKEDAAAALSALITAAARPGLDLAPMFLITAPTPGTGKTYLAEIISLLATPRISAPLAFPLIEAEFNKVLHSALLRSPPVLLFDNLTADIPPHDKLCAMMTSERAEDRTLGMSKIEQYSTRTLVLATGNNVRPHRDMNRRVVTIRLDSKASPGASRAFKNPQLRALAKENRARFVADALTIVRAWIGAGCPKAPGAPSVRTFDNWSDWCRQPLLWMGLSDPAASIFEQQDDDPDRRLLQRLLAHWVSAFGDKPTMVRNLVEAASTSAMHSDLREVLIDISDHGEVMNRRRIGKWIARHVGHPVDGRRLESVKRTLNADSWKVVSV